MNQLFSPRYSSEREGTARERAGSIKKVFLQSPVVTPLFLLYKAYNRDGSSSFLFVVFPFILLLLLLFFFDRQILKFQNSITKLEGVKEIKVISTRSENLNAEEISDL